MDQPPILFVWRVIDRAIPLTLVEITSCPQSLYCSYRAVVYDTREMGYIPFSELAQVFEAFGPVGTINDLGVKQLHAASPVHIPRSA
jgi:hypothetical protein